MKTIKIKPLENSAEEKRRNDENILAGDYY